MRRVKPGPTLALRSHGGTDIGRHRKTNQDAFLSDDSIGLYVVADGMGGHAAGEVASAEAVDTIFGMVKRGIAAIRDSSDKSSEGRVRAARRLLEGAIQAATYMVFALAELDRNKSGMGTTITAALVIDDSMIIGQVGDSRIYQVRGGRALQVTEDHTLIAWQVKQGLLTEDEAKSAPHKNVITRAVGNREYVQVDTSVLPISVGDRYVLCSDGLHGYLEPDEIASIVELGSEIAVQSFIETANQRGGRDNITAVVIEVGYVAS